MKLKQACTYLFTAIIVGSPLAASAQTYSSQADSQYLYQVNQSLTRLNSSFLSVPDNEKIAVAQYACIQLNGGRTVASLNNEFLGASFKIDEQEERKDFLNFLVLTQVAGIHAYCPQHIQQLKDNIEASRQN